MLQEIWMNLSRNFKEVAIERKGQQFQIVLCKIQDVGKKVIKMYVVFGAEIREDLGEARVG